MPPDDFYCGKGNETMELIDKNALYKQFVELEAAAWKRVEKHMNDGDMDALKLWTAILNERTAYKHDVADAPAVEAEPVRRGEWIRRDLGGWHCSLCDEQAPFWCMASTQELSNYCPNCGALMDLKGDEDDTHQ